MNAVLPVHGASGHLLALLRDVAHARTMGLADWDRTLRLARQSRLLGVVSHRVRACEVSWRGIPEAVRGHLRASINYSAYRAHLVRAELAAVGKVLPSDVRVVLLKGAAYLAQDLPIARGRISNDVDLLVCRADLDRTEAALLAAGWATQVVDEYDQRYYREWSHELPPMRASGHALEVDLHHTIAPVTSRTRVDDALLIRDRVPLTASRYEVLHPHDQIIHAAIHLFQDSELDDRLRDLVDIDGLIRGHLDAPADWLQLTARAERHNAARMLWYALHYCHGWLGTHVPPEAWPPPPSFAARRAMDWVFSRASLPRIPDRAPGPAVRFAFGMGKLRYHLLRMPPPLLVRHLANKGWRSLRVRSEKC